ncbi:23S rRNA (uracil-5-)-methyltransferase RumB, partial [Yersinia pestis PY-16]
MHCA